MINQDYDIIAEMFRYAITTGHTQKPPEKFLLRKMINYFMNLAENQNPQFNRDIFLKACGVK